MRLDIDNRRLKETMKEQAEIGSAGERALDRLTLTDADAAVRDWFCDQLDAAGSTSASTR